jgi:Flp pilus assembly protein TadG
MQSNQRGVILIFVALTILALMTLSAFVIDLGVFWLGRAQAQNAADAGALAGATALMVDDSTNVSPSGAAYQAAASVAASNDIFGGTHGTEVFTDPSVAWTPAAPAVCAAGGCVQVSVYQDGTHSSATLPTYFARVFAVNSQGVKATATAQVSAANGSGCMRPWFIQDFYTDSNGNGRYDSGEPIAGYQLPADIGKVVQFHLNSAPSSYGQLDVGSGGDGIRDAIKYCAGPTFAIGQTAQTKPGNTLGPEKQGMDAILSWDSNASWDSATKTIINSCASTNSCKCPTSASQCPYSGMLSPRIVQAAICSPAQASCSGSAGAGSITITNILSFFVTTYSVDSGDLVINAVVLSTAGLQIPGGGSNTGSFVKTLTLVR